jgi:cytochrome c biogenesis protein
VDVRKVDLRESVESRLGAANKTVTKKELRNVGPSVTYKLRDAAGQAREFHNYMLPVDTGDGVPVFLLGVRETPAEPFRYLRVPADDKGGMDGFLRMKAVLADPDARELAVRRYVAQAIDASRSDLAEQLQQSASRALALFAGEGTVDGKPTGGLQAVSDFMEANVPEAERARAGEVLVRILNGTLFEVAQLARQRAGLPPLPQDESTRAFMTQAVLSLSDAQIYPAPLAFELKDFTQVQASVFQVARAPGKSIVYLGCALLILGVFAMLYVRERRVWVWVAPQAGGTHATMALSTNRKTIDGDREFVQLAQKLIGAGKAPEGSA